MVLERLEVRSQPHLGSALGYLVGVSDLNGTGSPATLAGMGAFFSVVSKVPITAIVIVFEMTTDFNWCCADDWLCNSLSGCQHRSWVALWRFWN